jgi:hypothetical protein
MQQFEKLERVRMKILHELFDRYAQSHDFFKSSVEQIAIVLHRSTDAINIPKDIQDFIKLHDQGTKPKEHAQYIPRKSQIIDHAIEAKSSPLPPPIANHPNTAPIVNRAGPAASVSHPPPPPPFVSPHKDSSLPNTGAGGHLVAPSNIPPPFTSPHRSSIVSGQPPSVSSQPSAIALYDFESTESDDLQFKAGDVITLLSSEESEDWWQGEINGRSGIFPKNYVQKQTATTAVTKAGPPAIPAHHHHSNNDTNNHHDAEAPKLMDAKCAALYDFEGQDADELTFKSGQTLIITGELNGWYLGRVDGTTKVGIFPSNYVSIA